MNNNYTAFCMGALAAGYICGLLPQYLGKKKNREGWGNAGMIFCILAAFIGGFVFALPTALVFTLIIGISGEPNQKHLVVTQKDARVQSETRATTHPEAVDYRTCLKCHHSNPKNAVACEKCGAEL